MQHNLGISRIYCNISGVNISRFELYLPDFTNIIISFEFNIVYLHV
jgi:hypothetical protein